ncbi:MAG: YhhN-like protein [Benjaminiella poitrasii]|nr:MAG: YhhN-like protein [Benjaminiella poitrasii]
MFPLLTLLSSLIYFYLIHAENVTLKYIFKPLTTLFIIGVAWQRQRTISDVSNQRLLLPAGLVFSLAGDILLMFKDDLFFISGLSSFLCAHLCYIRLFYRPMQQPKHVALQAALAVTGLAYFAFLYSGIYEEGGLGMVVAVALYVTVISVMVYYGVLRHHPYLTAGVLLFFLSDASIAYDKFIVKGNTLEQLIMSTYYLAQYFIAQHA